MFFSHNIRIDLREHVFTILRGFTVRSEMQGTYYLSLQLNMLMSGVQDVFEKKLTIDVVGFVFDKKLWPFVDSKGEISRLRFCKV